MQPVNVVQSVYLERQGPYDTEIPGVKRPHKLQPRADRLYKVVFETSNTVTILRDGLEDVLTRNSVAVARPHPTSLAQQAEKTSGVRAQSAGAESSASPDETSESRS